MYDMLRSGDPAKLTSPPQPDQDRLGGVVPQRFGLRTTRPGEHPTRQRAGSPLCLFAAALLASVEQIATPLFCADNAHGDLPSLPFALPDVDQRTAPFEHHPRKVRRLIEDRWRRTTQPGNRAQILRACPADSPIIPEQRETGAQSYIDGKQR